MSQGVLQSFQKIRIAPPTRWLIPSNKTYTYEDRTEWNQDVIDDIYFINISLFPPVLFVDVGFAIPTILCPNLRIPRVSGHHVQRSVPADVWESRGMAIVSTPPTSVRLRGWLHGGAPTDSMTQWIGGKSALETMAIPTGFKFFATSIHQCIIWNYIQN